VAKPVEKALASRWAKVVLFLLCLSPAAVLLWRVLHRDATANPIEFVEHWLGDWTLRLLLVTLAITPLRKLLHLPQLIRFRRMLGLFAFFYVCLHFLAWLVLDHFFAWREMWADVLKRRYITVGFTAFVLLVPLALTSTNGWMRRLGGKRWQKLHRLIYPAAILGVVHYWWLVKSDIHLPLEYAVVLAILLGARLALRRPAKAASARTA
jgi:sulfoxide reductase heme-binding subunit YedZ